MYILTSVVALVAFSVEFAFAVPSSRNAFSDCLSGISTLKVVTSSSSEYGTDVQSFNRRFSYQPAAVVYPTSQNQVSQAVKCAASAAISVSARSGGHSYAAYGLGGQDGSLIVDLSLLKNITLDKSNGLAVSGTGNTLGSLATYIYNNGQRVLPHGTCPYVGTGGHTSFGGFGLFSRQAGLLLDRVVAADVVLANGTSVTATQSTYPDLLWALRGAAPSFGIVTAWHYATLAAPPQTINWQLNFSPFGDAASVATQLIGFQNWVSDALPNAVGVTLSVGVYGGQITLQYVGAYYGQQTDLNNIIAHLQSFLPPSNKGAFSSSISTNWLDGLCVVDGSLDTSRPDTHDTFFAKSLMTFQPLSTAAWTSFAQYLVSTAAPSPLAWFALIDLYGGAVDSVASSATAYANRGAQLAFQLYASSSNHEPPYPSNGIPFLNDMLASITTSPAAAYPNYVDPTLSASQWQSLYFGKNYAKLSAIRKQYDPQQVFKFPQEIV